MARRPVPRMRSLSLRALLPSVKAGLDAAAALGLTEVDKTMRDYVLRAEPKVLRQIQDLICPQHMSGRASFLSLRLLLCRGVTSVRLPALGGDLGHLGDLGDLLALTLPLLRPLAEELRTLDLSEVAFPDDSDEQDALCQALSGQEFAGLCELSLRSATDLVLEAVAKGCPVLKTLHLQFGEPAVSLRGLRALIAGRAAKATLQQVSLWDEGPAVLRPREVTVLLRGLPLLRSLGCCSADVGPAVAALRKAKRDHPPLALEHLSAKEITDVTAAAVAKLCPALKWLRLERPSPNVQCFDINAVGGLIRLSSLPRLETLAVVTVDVIEVMESTRRLAAAGARLTSLTLAHVTGSAVELSWLARFCPHLTSLCIRGAGVVAKHKRYGGKDDNDDDDVEEEKLAFSELLDLDLLPLQGGGVAKEILVRLIRGAPKLKSFDVSTAADQLTDADVADLCPAGNQLADVRLRRDFRASGDEEGPERLRLTHKAALTFLERCPRLVKLGVLNEWSVAEAEVADLRRHCRRNNLRVDLLTCSGCCCC